MHQAQCTELKSQAELVDCPDYLPASYTKQQPLKVTAGASSSAWDSLVATYLQRFAARWNVDLSSLKGAQAFAQHFQTQAEHVSSWLGAELGGAVKWAEAKMGVRALQLLRSSAS